MAAEPKPLEIVKIVAWLDEERVTDWDERDEMREILSALDAAWLKATKEKRAG